MTDIPIANKILDTNLITSLSKKQKENVELREAAEQFESLFVSELLKRANAAKLAKGVLSSNAEETYTSLLNQERSKMFAKEHNFGIAEALVRQFGGSASISKDQSNLIRK